MGPCSTALTAATRCYRTLTLLYFLLTPALAAIAAAAATAAATGSCEHRGATAQCEAALHARDSAGHGAEAVLAAAGHRERSEAHALTGQRWADSQQVTVRTV
jgi:hypothetical protein